MRHEHQFHTPVTIPHQPFAALKLDGDMEFIPATTLVTIPHQPFAALKLGSVQLILASAQSEYRNNPPSAVRGTETMKATVAYTAHPK